MTPIKHDTDKKCTFGATITGLNLNDISNEDLASLKEATHRYQLVMIKGQHDLDPVKHWELITRLDPEAQQVHGHGTPEQFKKVGGLLSVRTLSPMMSPQKTDMPPEQTSSSHSRRYKRPTHRERLPRRRPLRHQRLHSSSTQQRLPPLSSFRGIIRSRQHPVPEVAHRCPSLRTGAPTFHSPSRHQVPR